MAVFSSILYLDDVRVPTEPGIALARNYEEFVDYLETKGIPDLISFDHDLAHEHYPVGPNKAGQTLPYHTYLQQTGLHCAHFIVDNRLDLKHWAVHSSNVQGRINIERVLRRYRRQGEVRDLQIPFHIPHPWDEPERPDPPPTPPRRQFSSTSLLQFEEDLPLESWELGAQPLPKSASGR